MKKLYMSASPHIFSKTNTKKIMLTVTASLLPATFWGLYVFGIPAFLTILTSIVAAVFTEWLACRIFKFELKVNDGSSVLTGLLLALTLPPETPLAVTFAGSFFAVFFGKMIFGGLGYNPFNPALIGRAFLLASWPVYITTWKKPLREGLNMAGIPESIVNMLTERNIPQTVVDTITSATPLNALKQSLLLLKEHSLSIEQFDTVKNALFDPGTIKNLFFGNIGGSIGEVSALLLLLGGLLLIFTRVITWHVPVIYTSTVAILGFVLGGRGFFDGNILFYLFSGGLFLGAFFMATDYVTSPMFPAGKVLFAVFAGILVVVIRRFGGYPEGVCYSILIMNAFVPILDRFTAPKPFGLRKKPHPRDGKEVKK